MEKEPNHFECLEDDQWKQCDKEYICTNNLPKDHYRVVQDDETFDNWVEKFDMLCEPKYKIGLIGSMYFIGVVVSMTFVGYLADIYGRKWPFLISIILQCIAQFGLMVSDNLYEVYFFEFLLGFTFAGRVVVGLCYVMEFSMPPWYDNIVFWYLMSENINTILYTSWY